MNRQVVEPEDKIDAALSALVFYFGLTRLVETGGITPDSFLSPGSTSPAEGVTVNPMKFTRDDLNTHAFNTMLMMIGSTTIVVDDALDDRFGKGNKESKSGIGQIHAVIHQIRNCFAHKPLNPVWRIFRKYRKIYIVKLPNGNTRTIDLRSLNGTEFKLEDIGGLNILIGMCMSAHDATRNQA